MLSAAFDEQYASSMFRLASGLLASAARVREPSPLDMLTIRPCLDFFSSGSRALVTRKTPKTLVSYVFWSASTVNSEPGIQSSAIPHYSPRYRAAHSGAPPRQRLGPRLVSKSRRFE